MACILRILCFCVLLKVAPPLAAQTANPGALPPGTRADYWNDPRYQEAVKRLAKVREWQATIDIKTDYTTTRAPPTFPNTSFASSSRATYAHPCAARSSSSAIPGIRTHSLLGTPSATPR